MLNNLDNKILTYNDKNILPFNNHFDVVKQFLISLKQK
jgi:hypothetical protein